MSVNTSKPGLAMQHSRSWFQISVSDISLEEPVKKARSILKDQSEEYTRLLYKLFWGTVKQAELEKADIRKSLDSLFTEYPKKHFLAALILGSVANGKTRQAHLAYQKLSSAIEGDLIELARETIEKNEKQASDSARNMPNVKSHILKKYESQKSRKAINSRWGAIETLCKNAVEVADGLWATGDRKDHAAMTNYLVDEYNFKGAYKFSGLSENKTKLRGELKKLAEEKYPQLVRGVKR
jgi:hypothetical protein